jgi:hypothetical protein
MNELRVACKVWSTEVCEVSFTKSLREKPAKIRLEKDKENLEKVFTTWRWRAGNHGACPHA